MGADLERLVDLLDLERLEVNLFRGESPNDGRVRVFGGQVLAQALVAAARTVDPDRHVHSLHSYFLRPGDPEVPIVFEVDRIRDGRSFATRRVVAIQHGRAIFNLQASFQVLEDGPDHGDVMPDVAAPESVARSDVRPPTAEARRRREAGGRVDPRPDAGREVGAAPPRDQPIDVRFVQGPHWSGVGPRDPDQDVWVRADGELPDDPLVHASIVAYCSDLMLLGTSTLPHRDRVPDDDAGFMIASIDHAIWFHRPCRADEWLLYHCHSPSAAGARGFSLGEIFRRDGVLCATIAQEGLVRPLA
ncbi:MAG TPA: acyl-CoA thioesterase II [Acidimicrobiia bacterium]|nr:acyl-CoA thioesterase II [Acidimicrobiia bacterium]